MGTFWLILIGVAGGLLAGATGYLLFRRAPDAAELEQRRLRALLATGRITAGEIVDIRGFVVCFSYEVAGVGYTACQDLSGFPEAAGGALTAMSGSISVRFDRANPGNSMVHCETWSGLPWPASNKGNALRPGNAHRDLSGAA